MHFLRWPFGKSSKAHEETSSVFKAGAMPPELIMNLAERVVYTHIAMGAASPVSDALAAEISFKLKVAREKHDDGMKHLKTASDALQERDAILGIRNSPGGAMSLQSYLLLVRDLVATQKGENTLPEWGFTSELKKFGR